MKITLPERLAGTRDALFVLEVEFPVATEERKVEVATEGPIEALDLRGTGPGGTYDVPVGLERLHIPMRVTGDDEGEAKVLVTCVEGPEKDEKEEHTLLLEKGPGAAGGSRSGAKRALVALVVAALAVGAFWAGPKLFGGAKVPSVAGMSQHDAIAKLQEAEYLHEVVTEDVADESKHGVALRTVPAAGEALAKGERVQLVIGTAQERMVKLATVQGQTEQAASDALRAAGFQPVTQYIDAGPGDEPGRVLRQSPAGGAHLERGSQIELFVARKVEPQPDTPQPDTPQPDTPQPDAPQPDTPQPDTPQPDTPQPDTPQPDTPQPDDGRVVLPRLVGMSFEDAESKLEGLGLLAIPESKLVDDAAQKGMVLAQFPEFDPQQETRIAPGQQVLLTVGRYEAPEPKTPEPKTPEPKTPEPKTPEPKTPEPKTPEPKTPEPKTPEPKTPEPKTPEPKTPEPKTPEPKTPQPETPGARVEVPDLIAMSREKATGLVRKAGLWYRVQLEETTDLPDGQVVSQRPQAGETLERGGTVDLVVARAPVAAGIAVPNVLGKTREEAERILRDGEKFLVSVTYGGGPLDKVGTVSSQNPAAGSTAGRRTWVNLVVVGGSGPEREAAGGAPKAPLPDTGSQPSTPGGSGELERAPTVGEGPLTRPAPTAKGAQPPRRVNLPGRDAEATRAVPAVKGMPAREAIRATLEAGLIPIVEPDRQTADGADGTVTRVRPEAGSTAKSGDLVRLRVKIAPRMSERYVDLPTALSGFLETERRRLQGAGYRVEVVELAVPDHPYAGTGRVAAQFPVSSVPRSMARTITLWVVK